MTSFRSRRGKRGRRVAYPITPRVSVRTNVSIKPQSKERSYEGWANWDTWQAALYINNESELYSRKEAWVLNFARKMTKGTFNRDLAKKALKQYLVKEAIKFGRTHYDIPKGGEMDVDINKVNMDEILDMVLESANWLIKNQPEKLKIQRYRAPKSEYRYADYHMLAMFELPESMRGKVIRREEKKMDTILEGQRPYHIYITNAPLSAEEIRYTEMKLLAGGE